MSLSLSAGDPASSSKKDEGADSGSEVNASGGASSSAADVSGDSLYKRSAAFFMQLAPGSVVGFYGSSVGFYVHHFNSRSFFIGMLLSMWLPFPFVAMAQEKYDAYFDDRYNARNTYYFRTVVMQASIGLVVLAWVYMDQTPLHVLVSGFCLGTCASAVLSSSMQLVSALDPVLSAYATTGEQGGKLMAVLVYAISGFAPDSSLNQFRMVNCTVVVVCVFVAAYLSYLHFSTHVFEKAYRRLSTEPVQPDSPRWRRSESETAPLLDEAAASGQIPRWVTAWSWTLAIMLGLSSFLWSSVSFVGSPELAQHMSLMKLAMDVAGQVFSICLPQLPGFYSGPWHASFLLSFSMLLVMAAIHIAGLEGFHIPEAIFWPSWCLFNFLVNFNASWVRITTALYVPVADRKDVSRSASLLQFAGGLAGAVISFSLVMLRNDLSDWPSWTRTIRD